MNLIKKIKEKLWSKLVTSTRRTKFYPFIYITYWHFFFNKKSKLPKEIHYFTARPNPGAGIGHQIANWIAGYFYAKQFGLNFCHIPFSTKEWDDFLGFGENEILYEDLIRRGYKKVVLPLFKESNKKEFDRIKKIIKSYNNKRVIFVCEQDQFLRDQSKVMTEIQQKFHSAPHRKNDKLIFDSNNYNIALHIRRGDIVISQKNKDANLQLRWQNNDYFIQVLSNTLNLISCDKPIHIYLFSQGEITDFKEFNNYNNVHFCLDMNARESFLHMVYADLLITSKSSFSYKPALLNNGIKICPKDFWHGYPENLDWVLADENGNFDRSKLKIS